jgi:hypothetical protein
MPHEPGIETGGFKVVTSTHSGRALCIEEASYLVNVGAANEALE